LSETTNTTTYEKTEFGSVSIQALFRDGRGGFFAALAVVVPLTAAAIQPGYSVTDLGILPGTAASFATGLNDRGEVVGYCAPTPENLNEVGFVWRNGVMVSTGKLPKGQYSFANAINSAGVAVGDGDTGNGRPQSWVTTPKGLVNFFPNTGGNTHAIGINDAATICGYYTKSLSGSVSSWRGAIWTPDPKDPRRYSMMDLPILVGPDPTFKGTSALPWAFNQAGQAAGYAANEVIGQHACFWNNDVAHSIVDLGVFPGDWSSLAFGMNELGQVAGTSHPPFGSRPVVWNNDAAHTVVELQPLPGDNYGTAAAINALGQVIGTSYYGTPGTWDATVPRSVIWRDGAVFELQASLEAVTGAGWTLTEVRAINDVGQIVGSGTHNGVGRAFLLTPIVQPTAAAAFLSAQSTQ